MKGDKSRKMKITKEADYALRIVAMLAKSGTQMEAKLIAEKNGIPYRFTLKILRKIVQAGYLKSFRGVNGGYMLNKAPEDISLLDIIETIDGEIAINICLTRGECCTNTEKCAVKHKLMSVQQMIKKELGSITFKDIIEEMQ